MRQQIFGLELLDLPEGYLPFEATAVIKALDEEGNVSLLTRSTDSLNAWESLGMLIAAADSAREGLRLSFQSEGPGDEDEDDE